MQTKVKERSIQALLLLTNQPRLEAQLTRDKLFYLSNLYGFSSHKKWLWEAYKSQKQQYKYNNYKNIKYLY